MHPVAFPVGRVLVAAVQIRSSRLFFFNHMMVDRRGGQSLTEAIWAK